MLEEFDSFFIGCIVVLLSLVAILIKRKWLVQKLKLKATGKVISWNIFITIFCVFVIFIVGESYYRFFVDTTDSFGINKMSQRWKKRYSKLNNGNVRDNITYYPKIQSGKRRLTIIGDSFSEGHGIKNLDKRFGNIIRKKYPNIEVHVIAVPGSNSLSQLENLERLTAIDYEFDVVMLAYCLNDIDYCLNGTKRIYNRIHGFNSELGYLAKNSYFINSLVFKLFAFNDPDFMNYSDFVLNGYNGETWETQKETLHRFKEYIYNHNGKLVSLTFPFLQQKREDYQFNKAHELIEQFWAAEGIYNIDLRSTYEPYYGEQLTINKYDAHPNEFAHQLAADKIENFLKNRPKN